ncbi:hypothetical protein RND81_03G196500 [Saponaria officinalis]|uniref:Uncharacterized protein n=1 Tax=Saponaria officinalis TaxID=3572 RepID=A0AAW1M9B3_SAPOF
MSSNYSLLFVCLLCLISLLTTTTVVVVGRHVGVINNGVPHNLTKSLAISRSKQGNDTWSTEVKTKVKIEQNKRQVSKNNHIDVQEFEVIMNKGERQGYGKKIPNYSKHIKNKYHKTGVVTWRVPKEKKGVPNTGFNLDYAPPKLHPPSHN